MQYRRYEKIYPNSTCKQHCDPTKGWVPLLKVNMSFLFVSYVVVFVNARRLPIDDGRDTVLTDL